MGDVISDEEGGFMPSVYPVKLMKISTDLDPGEVYRVVSYVKEFRLQLEVGDKAIMVGDLERVVTKNDEFHQITLSYGPGYFDQVLKTKETPR